jgi:hypothetical protein
MKNYLSSLIYHASPATPQHLPNESPSVGQRLQSKADIELRARTESRGELRQLRESLPTRAKSKSLNPLKYVSQVDVETSFTSYARSGKPFKVIPQLKPPGVTSAAALQLGTAAATEQAAGGRLGRRTIKGAAASKQAVMKKGYQSKMPGASGAAAGDGLDELHDPSAFSRKVKMQFGDNQATANLIQRLMNLAPEHSGDEPDLVRPVLVAHALGGALTVNCEAAHATLDYLLTEMDFHSMLEAGGVAGQAVNGDGASTSAPTQDEHGARPDLTAQARGWHAAQILARSDQGFDALMDIVHAPPSPEQRGAVRSFLQAADHLCKEAAPRTVPQPGQTYIQTVLQQAQRHAGNPVLDSLASRVMRASAVQFAAEAGARQPPLSAEQKGILFSWRQGFREDGAGSALARVQSRSHKFVRTAVSRAETRTGKSVFNRMIGRKKTALASMRLGMHGAHLSNIPKEQEKYCKAFQALSNAMAAALTAQSSSPALPLSDEIRRKTMLAGVLEMWGGMESPKTPGAFKLDEQVLQQVAARLAPPEASPLHQIASDEISNHDALPLSGLIGQAVTLDLLEYLAHAENVVSAPVTAALKDARSIENADDLVPTAMTGEGIAKVMIDLVQSMQQSGRVRFTDGGLMGLSTRGMSANLGKLLHLTGIPIGPRLDLRTEHARYAALEIARTTHGYELFLGTVRGKRNQIGGGVRVGYDYGLLGLQMRSGAAITTTPYDEESSEPCGVIFRIARQSQDADHETWATVKYDDAQMVRSMTKLVTFLLEQSAGATNTHTSPEALWGSLGEKFFDDHDLSVGWQSTKSETSKKHVTLNAGTTVAVGSKAVKLRVGPNVGGTLEYTSRANADLTETGGVVRLEQHRVGKGLKLTVGGGLMSGLGASKGAASMGPGGVDGITGHAVVMNQGHVTKCTLPLRGDRLIHRGSYADTEYTDAETYIQSIEQERSSWIEMLSRMHGGDRGAAGARLDAYIGMIRANKQPNHAFLHRLRLTPRAARELDSLRALGAQMGDDANADELNANRARILGSPDSWVPHKLAIIDRSSTKSNLGLTAGLRAAAVSSVEGARELQEEQFR